MKYGKHLLHKIVQAGFSIELNDKNVVVATNPWSDISKLPADKIGLPHSIQVRFLPNQNKTTDAFPARNPPRVRITNKNEMFETMEDYRDYLYESYENHLASIREARENKLDARWQKHEELLEAERIAFAPRTEEEDGH